MLGYEISLIYMAQLKADEIRRQELGLKRRKILQNQIEDVSDSNEIFCYIAGYTSNGIPFGITWEEIEEQTEEEMVMVEDKQGQYTDKQGNKYSKYS